jgi:hypothetical protein
LALAIAASAHADCSLKMVASMSRRDQTSLDHVAIASARRQCNELFRRFWPEPIPPLMVATAAAAFETAARHVIADLGVNADHSAILQRLSDQWAESFSSTLRRLAREDRP